MQEINHLEAQICLDLLRQNLCDASVEVRKHFHCQLRIYAALHNEIVEGISECDPNAGRLKVSSTILQMREKKKSMRAFVHPSFPCYSEGRRDEEPAAAVELIVTTIVHGYEAPSGACSVL